MGSVFLKSRYNRTPNKDFTHITLHELMHTQGMGFPCIEGVQRAHIRSETNMLGHGIELDENIYIHDIEGCPQLIDSVYLKPTITEEKIMILFPIILLIFGIFGAPLFAVIAASAMLGYQQEGIDLMISSENTDDFNCRHITINSNNELSLLGKNKIDKKNVVDTLQLARDKFPGSSISLDALCKRYRVDNSRRVKHTALIDCELLYKVYINLIDQKEPTLNFKNQENDNLDININNNNLYYKKIVKPTPKELQLHQNYLKMNLKKNYFN